jgi:hypothetical protein
MTAVLYSLRKRSRQARWGRMASWLQFHIFTGLVGPYLVLLHTSWKFNGLAGLLVLFTVVIVASGFIGRYIYTAVPRTVDGVEIEAGELEQRIQATELELRRWLAAQPAAAGRLGGLLAAGLPGSAQPGVIFTRVISDWSYRWRWRQSIRHLPLEIRAQAGQLEALQMQKRVLYRQLASLALTRRMLGLWHSIHMPIGMALFATAFIHVAAVLYFAASLR